MEKQNFYVPTVTQAMRGKEILTAAGIQAQVGRNTDMQAGKGCGFVLTVFSEGQRAERLLMQKNVRITRKRVLE